MVREEGGACYTSAHWVRCTWGRVGNWGWRSCSAGVVHGAWSQGTQGTGGDNMLRVGWTHGAGASCPQGLCSGFGSRVQASPRLPLAVPVSMPWAPGCLALGVAHLPCQHPLLIAPLFCCAPWHQSGLACSSQLVAPLGLVLDVAVGLMGCAVWQGMMRGGRGRAGAARPHATLPCLEPQYPWGSVTLACLAATSTSREGICWQKLKPHG